MQNPVVYRAINIISEMCASIPLRVYETNDKHLILPDHPLTKLLENPHPKMAKSEFLIKLISNWLIAGTTYLFGAWPDSATFTTSTPPTGLYTLPPYYITPQIDIATNELTAYRYDYGRGHTDYDVWRILPIKSFHPLDELNGFSPLFAASMAVDRMNEGEKWNISLMQHAARPSGAFITDGNMSDPDFDLLKNEIHEKYTGSNRAGVPMLLEGGLKYIQMGLSPLQIDWLNGDKDAGRKISMAIGVDPLLLNDKENSTYNNVEQARIALVDQTALPLLIRLCEDINMWLMPYYGDTGRLSVDMKYIDLLRQDRQATSVMMVGEYNNGVRGFVSAQSELGIKTPDFIKEFYRMGIGVYVLETDIPDYLQQQRDARTAPPLAPQLPNGPAGTQQIGAPRNGTSPQLNAQAKFPKTIVSEETVKVKSWSLLEPKEHAPLPDVIMQYLTEQKQTVLDALTTASSPDALETATRDAHTFLQNTLDAKRYFKYNQNHDEFGRFSNGDSLPSPQIHNGNIHGLTAPSLAPANVPVPLLPGDKQPSLFKPAALRAITPVVVKPAPVTLPIAALKKATLTPLDAGYEGDNPRYTTTVGDTKYFVKEFQGNITGAGADTQVQNEMAQRAGAIALGLGDTTVQTAVYTSKGASMMAQPFQNGYLSGVQDDSGYEAAVAAAKSPLLTTFVAHEYLAGTGDRHNGQYLANANAPADVRLKLIDFGLGYPESDSIGNTSALMDSMSENGQALTVSALRNVVANGDAYIAASSKYLDTTKREYLLERMTKLSNYVDGLHGKTVSVSNFTGEMNSW